MAFAPASLRPLFPALAERHRAGPVVYFDNACTTLRPQPVLDAVAGYYRHAAGCHGRTDHLFGRRTTQLYDEARAALAKFVNARHPSEIVFVRNATEAVNTVARGLEIAPGAAVLTSELEHNSNHLPWQQLALDKGVRHQRVAVRADTTLDLDALRRRLQQGGVRIVSVLWVSNVTGVEFPVQEICALAHRHEALVLLDAAQAPLSHRIDVRALDVDFLALSGHKMLGPAGTGVLYLASHLADSVRPLMLGGETVADATFDGRTLAPAPDRFEAGLRDYAGAAGLAAAARLVTELEPAKVREHLLTLNARATEALLRLPGVTILGPADPARRGGVLTFTTGDAPAGEVARLLDEGAGVMVRHGKQCAHPFFHARGLPDPVRASFAPYNTLDEVDRFTRHLRDVLRLFGGR